MCSFGCAIILILLGDHLANISSEFSKPNIVGLIRKDAFESKNEFVADKMNHKRRILERGCLMIESLFRMSQNGTSYEDLLTWHARIHDLDYHLSPSNEKCYPALQYSTTMLYHVPGEKSTSLFCLPPKCGTTSYQRALSQQIISLISNSNNKTMQKYVVEIKRDLEPFVKIGESNFDSSDLEKIGKVKFSSEILRAPDVYRIMYRFKNTSFQNPTSFDNGTETTVPIYPNIDYLKNRVINTRNPFSRLNAAWRDKFRIEAPHMTTKLNMQMTKTISALRPFLNRAELPGYVPLSGYTHSFHSFLRYVNQEDGESHLNVHWKSISLMCQPCRIAYNYIMDIDTAQEDSKYVFEELEFNSRLPTVHNHAKGEVKKALEDYYKEIPKSLIKKIYAKYYLDFVLYGFSTESVKAMVDIGTEEPSNYSYKSHKRFDINEFNQHRKVI